MTASGYPLLTALMAPCPAAEFLEQHWPRRPFATHGSPQRLPAVLRDDALASPAALAQRYRGNLRFTHGGCARMIEIDRVNPLTLQDMGMTLQFADLARCVPGADAFLRELEAELGVHERSAAISAFASPRDDGLSCHYDAQDLISIQLHGSKRFSYAPVKEIRNPYGTQFVPHGRPFDELYAQAAAGFPDPRNADFTTTEMRPRSVLFLPRGTWHRTTASENSLSVSVMVDPPPALECLLEQLRMLLLQDAEWRQPLYGAPATGTRGEQALARSEELLAGLPERIAQLKPGDLLRALSSVERRMREITLGTRFQRTPDARLNCEMHQGGAAATVSVWVEQTPTRSQLAAKFDVPASAISTFRWIEAQTEGPFTTAALQAAFPALPFATLSEVLQLCVKAQFLKLLWFAPLKSSTANC